MFERVTTYFGRLLRFAKPAFSTPGRPPETTAARASAVIPSDQGPKLKRVNPQNQKYTLRRASGNLNSVTPAASFKKGAKMNVKVTDSMPKTTGDNIIWMDLEMTGLDIEKDVIMEVGCIITDPNLNELARHPEIIIHVPNIVLDTMDSWCVATHGSSGLTEACRLSRTSVAEADAKLVEFMRQYTDKALCPLGGNSNFADRLFLKKYMPEVASHLHYRNIDVSTIKELVRRWYPKEYTEMPPKRFIHKTVADLEDSIAELKYYRSVIFKKPEEELAESESQARSK